MSGRKAPSVESYAHKAAKATLLGWLREGCVPDEYQRSAGLTWRVNRGAPFFGVWEEYPIVEDEREIVWDENFWWDDYDGTSLGELYPSWLQNRQPIPTFEELKKLRKAPKVIFDVAIQHKGNITNAIEIVHKHGLTERKRSLIYDLDIPTYVVEASWILSQVRRPDCLFVTEALNHNANMNTIEFSNRAGRRFS